MKNKSKSDLIVHVQYADNPAQAEAALDILRQGFQRGLVKASVERARNRTKDGEA
jgi:hypothetical protein